MNGKFVLLFACAHCCTIKQKVENPQWHRCRWPDDRPDDCEFKPCLMYRSEINVPINDVANWLRIIKSRLRSKLANAMRHHVSIALFWRGKKIVFCQDIFKRYLVVVKLSWSREEHAQQDAGIETKPILQLREVRVSEYVRSILFMDMRHVWLFLCWTRWVRHLYRKDRV